jgi:Xaa-Pro aminopeptidase
MGYLGPEVPASVQGYWEAIRDARDAAVEFLHEEWRAGRTIQGWQVDDVTRAVVRERGWDEYFIHRTGHSIDQDVHGMGPNIDNLETHETRKLITGVGFSIEPGIYVPGEVGLRTEIDVYMSGDGPVVTTPSPQSEIFTLLP